MDPRIVSLFIPILALMIPIVAMILRHQRIMAGVEVPGSRKGKDGNTNARTLAVLTETLERQHERIKGLTTRVEALETILTDEQRAALGPVLLASEPASEPAREPATAPVAPRPQVEIPAPDTMTTEEAVLHRNRDRA
ncbi:MAG: hypothetical protein LCH53_05480 [Bacteroidetes bacterium]|nr:hypothetical protein [Bacteroidota bacterium]